MARPVINKALAVGLLAAICGAAFLIAFTFFRKGGFSDKDSYQVFAYFDDATGLTWKSRVQIAGIQIGEVDKVVLSGSRAKLELRIRRDIDLRTDACLVKRFPSALLPDALLEVMPGSLSLPSLRDMSSDEREVHCVREATSVAKLMDSLAKVTADIQVVTGDLAQTVGGTNGSIRQIIENLSRVSRSIDQTLDENSGKLADIIDNTRSFTGTLAELGERDREKYHVIATNIAEATGKLNGVLDGVQSILGTSNQPQVQESVQGVRQALEKLNKTLEQVNKVSENVAEGKGVAGKLLSDERLGNKVSNSIEGISEYVDRLTQLQIEMELRSEWLLNQAGSKTYVGFKILPRPDKYYLVEIVNDPRGVDTISTQTVESGGISNQTTTTTHDYRLLFSAQLAKRYDWVTLRVGVIESSGGMGADIHLFDDHLQLSTSIYQFTRPPFNNLPRAKIWANYYFLNHLYVTAGADDFLNSWKAGRYPGGPKFAVGNDVFFGAGLFFNDDDVKTLLLGGAGSAVK